jgi:hypothetical protein
MINDALDAITGVVECKPAQQAMVREELAVQEHESRQCAVAGRREEENDQLQARRELWGVVERKSAQQAAATEELAVQE